MNQFANRKKLTEREKLKTVQPGKPWVFPMIAKLLLLPIAAFAACILRVHFADRAEKLERQAVMIREEIKFMDKEIQNLKGRREELYSLRHVESKIREYKLGLRPTNNDQLRHLQRYDIVTDPQKPYLVAENENAEHDNRIALNHQK